jgi:hypothetical protein
LSEDVSKDHLKKLLGELVDTDQPWSFLIKEKKIAQLGDSLANFIYSLALSLAKGKCTGTRVPDTVLTNAYHSSAVKTYLPVTGKKGRVGDAVEAVLLLSWLSGTLELDEMVMTLSSSLDISKRPTRNEELLGATVAFRKLLDEIAVRLS